MVKWKAPDYKQTNPSTGHYKRKRVVQRHFDGSRSRGMLMVSEADNVLMLK